MSNHIRDTNKKVSDTPRTNLEAFFPHDSMYQVCEAAFARQLERELNAANEMCRKLNIHALNLADRIKRLEDIINRASYCFFRDGSDGQVASQMLVVLEEIRKP